MPDLTTDRRRHARFPLDLFCNQYLDGYPHVFRITELSAGGFRASAFTAPEPRQCSTAVEVCLPGDDDPIWVWVEALRRQGRDWTLRIIAAHADDWARYEAFLATRSSSPNPPAGNGVGPTDLALAQVGADR